MNDEKDRSDRARPDNVTDAGGGAAKTPSHEFRTKDLSDEQIKALVTFIRSLKPKQPCEE